jgi:hypothetical protein
MVKCEHCEKEISKANYVRWHGDVCKKIDPETHFNRTKQIRNLNKKE